VVPQVRPWGYRDGCREAVPQAVASGATNVTRPHGGPSKHSVDDMMAPAHRRLPIGDRFSGSAASSPPPKAPRHGGKWLATTLTRAASARRQACDRSSASADCSESPPPRRAPLPSTHPATHRCRPPTHISMRCSLAKGATAPRRAPSVASTGRNAGPPAKVPRPACTLLCRKGNVSLPGTRASEVVRVSPRRRSVLTRPPLHFHSEMEPTRREINTGPRT